MKPYVYDAQDQMCPVYCISCRAHIPRAVSNAQAGLCHACNQLQARAVFPPPPQVPPTAIPPAPTPPTFWEQIFVPFAGMKYQAELGAYLHATGQVPDATKKTVNAVAIVVGICVCLVTITTTFSILRIFTGHDPDIQKFDAEMKRIQKRAEAEERRFDEEQRERERRWAEEDRRNDEAASRRLQEEVRRMNGDYGNY